MVAAFLISTGVLAPLALASIDVSPVRIDLSDGHDKDVVRISNREDSAKSYQVEVVAWSQTDERREVYSPTESLLAVPPIFTLEPGDVQIVRIGMLDEADAGVERAYRMFITELASPQSEESVGSGVRMRLQIGIPVFVAPKALPTSTLDYVDSLQIEEQLFLHFQNNGNTHVKITEIQFASPRLDEKVITPVAFYVLPGQKGYVPVAVPDGKPEGTVTLVTDTLGTLEYELPLTP